jgi:antitoxin HicB
MKNLEHFKKLNYKMTFEFDPEDGVYFVKFPELPGCIADGSTPDKALKNAIEVKNEWLETALESGWNIPEPAIPSKSTGRVTLRIPKYVHERIIERADREGVSLNQLILSYISEGIERSTAKEYFEKAIEQNAHRVKQLENIAQESVLWRNLALGNWGTPTRNINQPFKTFETIRGGEQAEHEETPFGITQ